MKIITSTFRYPVLLIFVVLLLCCFACKSSENHEDKTDTSVDLYDRVVEVSDNISEPAPIESTDEDVEIREPEVSFSVEAPIQPAPVIDQLITSSKKDFKVIFSADSLIYLGQSGMMQLWIGEEDVPVEVSKGMTSDIKKISSTIGKFAKITPFAPDFEVTPVSATVCYKIDPGGSEIRYEIKPKDEGEYRVSADIELFETPDCTGISVPKTAKAFTVLVEVNMKKEISKKIHWMESEAWDKFSVFWIALVTLFFGAAIFVIRRFIKNKTGYEDPTNPV